MTPKQTASAKRLRRKKRTPEQRLALIKKWSEFFMDCTETFEGELGTGLAYLWPSIAKGGYCEFAEDHALVRVLRYPSNNVGKNSPIWDYIEVMDD